MEEVYQDANPNASPRTQHPPDEIVGHIASFEEANKVLGLSQREYAENNGIPKSTFQEWNCIKDSFNAPREVVEFLMSPVGLVFLRRVMTAAMLVITQLSAGSIRNVCTFVMLAGLGEFVAHCYGTVQKAVKQMEEQIVTFGQLEFERLGKLMRPKKITILEDETFHPRICLVAMDGQSGFIFLELYAKSRDSKTWTKVLKGALGDLPVEVVQVTSDEAKALLKHTEVDLGANHSPDLFHVVRELFKGTSLAMARHVEGARRKVEEAREATERLEEVKDIATNSDTPAPKSTLDKTQEHIDQARAKEREAQEVLEEAEQRQTEMADAIRGISDCYHPYDLDTGEARTSEMVASDIKGQFDTIDRIAGEVSLSDSGVERIEKAGRVVTAMVVTIGFFHEKVRTWIEQLCLAEQLEQFILNRWIPARYVELVAERASDSDSRAILRQKAAKLMPSPQEIGAMLSSLCDNDRLLIAYLVEQCAQLFQRSSSPVEGRNGHLSLFHHGYHFLTESRLGARTVIHNYMKLRPDETTAAERFFGHPPRELFEWLLERMPYPVWPARRKSKLLN